MEVEAAHPRGLGRDHQLCASLPHGCHVGWNMDIEQLYLCDRLGLCHYNIVSRRHAKCIGSLKHKSLQHAVERRSAHQDGHVLDVFALADTCIHHITLEN